MDGHLPFKSSDLFYGLIALILDCIPDNKPNDWNESVSVISIFEFTNTHILLFTQTSLSLRT